MGATVLNFYHADKNYAQNTLFVFCFLLLTFLVTVTLTVHLFLHNACHFCLITSIWRTIHASQSYAPDGVEAWLLNLTSDLDHVCWALVARHGIASRHGHHCFQVIWIFILQGQEHQYSATYVPSNRLNFNGNL